MFHASVTFARVVRPRELCAFVCEGWSCDGRGMKDQTRGCVCVPDPKLNGTGKKCLHADDVRIRNCIGTADLYTTFGNRFNACVRNGDIVYTFCTF